MRLENGIIAEALQMAKNIPLLSLSKGADTLVMVAVCPAKVDPAAALPMPLCVTTGGPAGAAASSEAQRKLPRRDRLSAAF